MSYAVKGVENMNNQTGNNTLEAQTDWKKSKLTYKDILMRRLDELTALTMHFEDRNPRMLNRLRNALIGFELSVLPLCEDEALKEDLKNLDEKRLGFWHRLGTKTKIKQYSDLMSWYGSLIALLSKAGIITEASTTEEII